MILQRLITRDSNLLEDDRGVVLDCGYTSHLNRCLDRASEEQSAERALVGEELDNGFCLMLVLEGDHILDLLELSLHPRVALVAVGV